MALNLLIVLDNPYCKQGDKEAANGPIILEKISGD